jgi:carboxymethylenebutenolidase
MGDVTISVGEGTAPMHGYLRAPASAPKGAIIVAHELFGVNADIRGVVDHLAELGYLAVALELYHRVAPAGEALPRDDAGRDRGFSYLRQLSREDVVEDVRAAMSYLASVADVAGRVGMLGFSAGGHMAFLAATRLPLVATAVLYGGWLTGGDLPIAKPEPTLEAAAGIARQRGKLLYVVGGKDAVISPAQVTLIRSKLAEAQVAYELVVYPEAAHAFFWEGTPSFDRAARDASWRRVEAFFADALAQPG